MQKYSWYKKKEFFHFRLESFPQITTCNFHLEFPNENTTPHYKVGCGIPGKNCRQIFSAGKKHDGIVSFFCIKRPGRIKRTKGKKRK